MTIQDDESQNDIMGEQFDLSCIEALAPILARIPDQEPRVIAREARYLAINDLGKTVKGVDSSGRKFDGELIDFYPKLGHLGKVLLVVRGRFYGVEHVITPQTLITITGKDQS
ncbi:hypothetical protein [Glutamicibacter nicotianae]|uniref:hypothetical protein n=1 Tax=Glutamicibacter nicotianae TaxID=37929 RepID=UPI00167F5490|nr:hypothetical protein [Glutamicibacter nicotianae]